MAEMKLKPPGQSSETELAEYVRSKAYRSSPLYKEDFFRYRKAELYNQGDQTWLQPAASTSDSRYPTQLRRISFSPDDPDAIPLPVYNEGIAIIENESARLGRPEYKPRVRPRGENPSITEKEGADGAQHALRYNLKEMWEGQEKDRLTDHMPVYGGAWILSYWDQTWMETVRVPAPSMACPEPGCGFKSTVSQLSPQSVSPSNPTQPRMPTEPIPCPQCQANPVPSAVLDPLRGGPAGPFSALPAGPPETPNLEPYSPTMDEAQGDLGVDIPKGDWFMHVPFPYEMFPRDAGLGVNNNDVDEFTWVHLERLEWVEERWPHKVRDEHGELRIHPENPATLMSEDPTLSQPDILRYAHNTGAFSNHVLVYDYVKAPWMEWNEQTRKYEKNKGRHVTAVQKTIVRDDHLLVQSLNSLGETVPRIRAEYIRWQNREGGRRTCVGYGLWDRLADAADGINERKAHGRAVNSRGVSPWYITSKSSNLQTKAASVNVPFKQVEVDTDADPTITPDKLFYRMGGETVDPGIYNEIEDDRGFMDRSSGRVEVEKGQVPTGVSAATAIAYLKTESSEPRRPKINRIREALIRNWEHGLRLMAALYIESRPYAFEDEYGEERWAYIHGEVIAKSNPKVDIYPTPDFDVTDIRRESVREMVTLGVIDPKQTPQLNRKVVEAIDESLGDFFEDEDHQEEQSQREWRDFKDQGKVPVIDPDLDDPMTHYQVHGRACFSPWYRRKEEEAHWDEVLGVIGAGWDQLLLHLAVLHDQGAGQGQSLQQLIYQAWKNRIVRAMQPQPQGPPQPGQPPQPPQPGGQPGQPPSGQPSPSAPSQPQGPPAPPQLQLQLDDEGAKALDTCLHWRAHMMAHKMKIVLQQFKEQQAAQAALAGQPEGVQAPGKGSAPTTKEEQPASPEGAPEGGPGPAAEPPAGPM